MQAQFGDEYAAFLTLMGAIREKLLDDDHEPEIHKPLFEKLISRDLIDMIKAGRKEAIDSLLKETLGEGYAYDRLLAGDG
jgi:precorrin-2 dehydrogenase/sirohydrochlorin ferrochelatase